MKGPVTADGRDLRTLAGIVSDDRGEPPAEGLAPSLLGDLLGLIRCDLVVFCGTTAPAGGLVRADRSGRSPRPRI